jgi:hypothetical protein
MKEETTNSRLRAMDIGALTILRTFAPTNQKNRMMVVHLELFAPYQGQQERLERNHHENRATGRKVRPITDVTSTAFRKEEMAVCLRGSNVHVNPLLGNCCEIMPVAKQQVRNKWGYATCFWATAR